MSRWDDIIACGEARDKCKRDANTKSTVAGAAAMLLIFTGPVGLVAVAGAGAAAS